MTHRNVEITTKTPKMMENSAICEIMDALVSIPDVSGAGIITQGGSILSWHSKNGVNVQEYIAFALDYISRYKEDRLHNYHEGMFTQVIVHCNGHKILLSRLKSGLMLCLLLKRSAYLGLTMLDMEGCLRKLDRIMARYCS